MKKIAICVFLGLVMVGCASPEYEAIVAENQKIHQEITDKTTYKKPSKVQFIKKPPMKIAPVKKELEQEWLYETISVNTSGKQLSLVLEEIMSGVDIPIYFAEHVNPNKKINLNFSHTTKNVLNMLSRESGYAIEVKNGRLEVTQFITKVFPLNLPSGVMSGQLGSQGQTNAESNGRVEGQYLNVEYKEVDAATEIANSIKKILGGGEAAEEKVSVLPALSSISVTATPDQMQTVEQVIDTFQKELSKQALVELQIVQFSSNLSDERGIDWNVMKETGSGTLKFFLPGTNVVSQQAGYGFGFSGSGKYTGTEAFVKVLEQQGSVSTQTPVTALITNNQPAKLTQLREEPYLYEVSSDSSEGVVSQSVTREIEREGVDVMVNAKVQDEFLYLRISGQLRKIDSRDTETVGTTNLGFLDVDTSEITFSNRVPYGQTYVIASVKQSSKSAQKSTNFWSTLFGGTGSSNKTTETLVLMTTRKAM
nr:hypothetical protein [Vibrio coralliilyticus]